MAQYIDKDALVVEIQKIYDTDYKFLPSDIVEHVLDLKDDILRSIDTLEVKGVAVKQEKPKKPKDSPFKNPNQLTFWDYIGTINMEKEYDKWRLAMDIGAEYNAMSKDPDKFLNEIIQKIEQKLKTK